jgi:RimJ/RimL family protein N-acetyltransferase
MEVKLRSWGISDLNNLVTFANNWNVAKNLTDRFPHPYTEADGRWFIDFAARSETENIFAIEVEEQAVGGISIEPQTDIHKKNAELGYWLAESFWGRGIITTAIQTVIAFAFTTYDINRIFARPFGTNHASHRVLEKNKFILEARFEKVLYKKGEYLDELIYALRKESWQKMELSIKS